MTIPFRHLTRHSLSLFAILLISASLGSAAPPAPTAGNHWVMAFEDNFRGTSLNTSRWSTGYPWGRTHNHKAYMAPENVKVENGRMIITAEAKNHPSSPYSVNHDGYHVVNYTSGAINTSGKFNFTHGYVEGRFKLASGTGTWPAFWTLQGGWPPEIDIFENLNGNNTFYTNYHWGTWDNKSSFFNTHTGSNLTSAFRTYGLDWKPSSMAWYYQNNRVALLTNSSAISQSANNYLIVNLAVGGWPGNPNSAHYPTTFESEWVRVWKQVAAPAKRLIGHWRLNEMHPGPICDATGNADGTLVNAPLLGQPGPTAGNLAFDFSGAGRAVNTNRPAVIPASGDFNISVTFKTSGIHSHQGHLFSNNNSQSGRCGLFIENGLLKWWHHLGAALASSVRVDDGLWHRADLARKGNEWSLWLDGVRVDEGISDATVSQGTAWFIGRANQASFAYEGLISEVKVWNYARSEVSLLHHWKLDENPASFTGSSPLTNAAAPAQAATVLAPANATALVRFNETGASPATGSSIFLGGRYDRIELGNVSPRTDPFTISFWFKNNAYKRWEADQDHLLSANGGQAGRWNVHLSGDPAYLTQNGGPKLEFFQDGYGAILLAPVIMPGVWRHLALVRSEELQDNFHVYLDGELVHTGTNHRDFTNAATGVLAGRRPSSPMSSAYEGWLDDLRIYSGALGPEINELAGGGYDLWARAVFGESHGDPGTAPADDPGGSGYSNFHRYIFGQTLGTASQNMTRMIPVESDSPAQFEFQVRPDPTARYFIQTSSSLGDWESSRFRYQNPSWLADVPAAITLTQTSLADGIATVRATISPSAPKPPTRFMRLKVEMPESR